MNIPRYLISFTHEMTVLNDSDTGRHEALFCDEYSVCKVALLLDTDNF